VTESNAFYTKNQPLVKAASFTRLSETEVAQMRAFRTLNDPRIVFNEVFFYTPSSENRDIEGDDWPTIKLVSTAAGAFPTAARRKHEKQNPDGSTTTVVDQPRVLWNNHTVSPAVFQQVTITLK
jgi:hypothetical protein